jgi:tRNA (adenine-N(1)-)-methyltransferase non-catalytic subunit
MSVISDGCHVVLQNSKTGEQKCVKLPRKSDVYIKPLSFQADSLIGQRFGQKYQVIKHQLFKVEEPSSSLNEPLEHCGKTNEFIKDDSATQILSQNDIEEMKSKGVAGDEIVRNLVENSTTFNVKTEFSKAKWLKKKMNKHQPNIIVRKPSIRLFASSTVSKLRVDVLAKVMNNANVWSGSKAIVVECKDDLLTSAISQRVGDKGTVVQVFEQRLPHIMYCKWLDFNPKHMSALKYYPLKFLGKLKSSCQEENFDGDGLANVEEESIEQPPALGKRKREGKPVNFEDYKTVYELLTTEKFDSLIITAHYDPFPVVELLWGCLRSSGNLVVQTEYLSVVLQCANFVNSRGCSELSVVDQWFREIQVLPERTHPDMRMQTGGGFILSCSKLCEGIYEHGSDLPIVVETKKPLIKAEETMESA